MDTLDHANYHVWLHLRPFAEINHLNFADSGNRTRAASAASECAVHCLSADIYYLQITAVDKKQLLLEKGRAKFSRAWAMLELQNKIEQVLCSRLI